MLFVCENTLRPVNRTPLYFNKHQSIWMSKFAVNRAPLHFINHVPYGCQNLDDTDSTPFHKQFTNTLFKKIKWIPAPGETYFCEKD